MIGVTEIVPDCKRLTLQAVILGKVSIASVICSDGWRGYNSLVDAVKNNLMHLPVCYGSSSDAINLC